MAVSRNSMIGNAGEYYVCAELCKRNILALITPKNNPLFAMGVGPQQHIEIIYKTLKFNVK